MDCDVAYATTHVDYRRDVLGSSEAPAPRFYTFPDANLDRKARLLWQAVAIAWIVLRERPHVVISTGASAGYFALRLAKLLRCRTIWLDSIANVDALSVSGRKAGAFADLWLTQWEPLAEAAQREGSRLRYLGSVL
jgi:UDP-N-acetylglucosamine:LPS N-acetylglucosamine transferase